MPPRRMSNAELRGAAIAYLVLIVYGVAVCVAVFYGVRLAFGP